MFAALRVFHGHKTGRHNAFGQDVFWCICGVTFIIFCFYATQSLSSNHYQSEDSNGDSLKSEVCAKPLKSRRPSIFTKIINKQEPATIFYEDAKAIAFLGLHPVAPTQFLVVPKKQLATLEEAQTCDEKLLGHLFMVASIVAKQKGIASSGYRLVLNNGPDALQAVPHLHIHVFGGTKMDWPPGI